MKLLAKKWASLVVERVDEHRRSSGAMDTFDPDTTKFTLLEGSDPTPGSTLLDRVRASGKPERVYVEVHSAPPNRLDARRWRRSSFCTLHCCCVLQTLLREPSDYVTAYIRGRGANALLDYAEVPFPASPAPATQSEIHSWQRETADILLRDVHARPSSAARRRLVQALANPLSQMVEMQCALPPQIRRALPLCVEAGATAGAATSLGGWGGEPRDSRRLILAAPRRLSLPTCRLPPSGRSNRSRVPAEAFAWACIFDIVSTSFDSSRGAFGSVGDPIFNVIGRTDALEHAYDAVLSALGDTAPAATALPAGAVLHARPHMRAARTKWPVALNVSQVESLNSLLSQLANETVRESANDKALFAAVFAPQPFGAGSVEGGGAAGMPPLSPPAFGTVRTTMRSEWGVCRQGGKQGTGVALSLA